MLVRKRQPQDAGENEHISHFLIGENDVALSIHAFPIMERYYVACEIFARMQDVEVTRSNIDSIESWESFICSGINIHHIETHFDGDILEVKAYLTKETYEKIISEEEI